MKEINYWLLARLPRWLVVTIYTILAPVALVVGVVGLSWFVFNLTQWFVTTHAGLITILSLIAIAVLIGTASVVNDSLPKRKLKKKNDEIEFDDEETYRIKKAVDNYKRNLEDGNFYYSQDTHPKGKED